MVRRISVWLSIVALLACQSTVLRAADNFFESDGVKIHYVVEGEGEPVVLIHGFAFSANLQWGVDGIMRTLAKDYQVIALDNRGHGESGKPHEAEKYGAQMAEDVVRLLDHLHIDKTHVVGYSMGGFITAKLVASHPARLYSATIGGAGWPRPDPERLKLLKDLAESLEAGKGVGPLIEALTPVGQPKPSAEKIDFINQMVALTNDQLALSAVIRGMPGLAVTEKQLEQNKVPTLALIGSIDPLKRDVDAMAKLMANLKVVVIEGADHMTTVTNPLFITDLRKFLAANSPKAKQPAEKVEEPVGAAAGGDK